MPFATPAPTLQYQSTPSNFGPITSPAPIALALYDALYIQNLGTNPLFVKRGLGATTGSFSYIVAGGTSTDDGLGGSLVIDDFIGSVSFTGSAPRYNAWKR